VLNRNRVVEYIGEARIGREDCAVFQFAREGLGKAVRYNDINDANECSSYFVIHQLPSTKDFVALCLLPMSFISFGVFRPLDVPKDERVTYETLKYQGAFQQQAQEL
jgi:hypothetical protein